MLPTSVIKELRYEKGNVICTIEITGNMDESDVVSKFASWVDYHAGKAPPKKLWNSVLKMGLKRPLFIPTLMAFVRGMTGEFMIGISLCFWHDCQLNQGQRIVAVHRWLHKELKDVENNDIPTIIENDEFNTFFNSFGGEYKPQERPNG
jgi:hypothetical protein